MSEVQPKDEQDKNTQPGEFQSDTLKLRFSLPHPFRYRDYERYEKARNEAIAAGASLATSYNWIGACAIIDEWECEYMPVLGEFSDLEALADGTGNELPVVMWVGQAVHRYVIETTCVPKN